MRVYHRTKIRHKLETQEPNEIEQRRLLVIEIEDNKPVKVYTSTSFYTDALKLARRYKAAYYKRSYVIAREGLLPFSHQNVTRTNGNIIAWRSQDMVARMQIWTTFPGTVKESIKVCQVWLNLRPRTLKEEREIAAHYGGNHLGSISTYEMADNVGGIKHGVVSEPFGERIE